MINKVLTRRKSNFIKVSKPIWVSEFLEIYEKTPIEKVEALKGFLNS